LPALLPTVRSVLGSAAGEPGRCAGSGVPARLTSWAGQQRGWVWAQRAGGRAKPAPGPPRLTPFFHQTWFLLAGAGGRDTCSISALPVGIASLCAGARCWE